MNNKEIVTNEFLKAYCVISDLHHRKHKTILLAGNKDIIYYLDYLNSIISYMKKDIEKYKKNKLRKTHPRTYPCEVFLNEII